MSLGRSTVQRQGVNLDPDALIMMRALEYTIQHAGHAPATHQRIDGAAWGDALSLTASFSVLLGNGLGGVHDAKFGDARVAPRVWLVVLDQAILLFGDLRARRISGLTARVITPSRRNRP
jgi:hypothetical protein